MKVKLKGADWQQEFIQAFLGNQYRFLSLIAGRRAGKTFSFRTAIAVGSLETSNCKSWYIAPNYSQAKEQYEGIESLPALAPYISKTRMQPYPMITFKNGSIAGFRSFERPKSCRGSGLDNCFVDEIQDINGAEFWPVIRPLIYDRRGKLIIGGQHRGTESWYYKDLFLPGLKDGSKYKSWQIPSSKGLVFQSPAGRDELALVKQQVPKIVYEQEYECLPVANQAAVFDYLDLKAIQTKIPPKSSNNCSAICFGLDLGRVVDPSAMVGIEATTGEVVFAEKRPLGEKHEIGAVKARDIGVKYNDAVIVVDTTGGATGSQTGNNDAYVQHYRKYCRTMRAFNINRDNKSRLIGNLSLAIEQCKIKIPEQFTDLIKELSDFEYKCSSNGILTYQGHGGHNDDMVIALALAWEGILRGWYSNNTGGGLKSIVGSIGG